MGLIKDKDQNGLFYQWGAKGTKCYYDSWDEKGMNRSKDRALLEGYHLTDKTMMDDFREKIEDQIPSEHKNNVVKLFLNKLDEDEEQKLDEEEKTVEEKVLSFEDLRKLVDGIQDLKITKILKSVIDYLEKRILETPFQEKILTINRDSNGLISTVTVGLLGSEEKK